jgi:hypothetical protein
MISTIAPAVRLVATSSLCGTRPPRRSIIAAYAPNEIAPANESTSPACTSPNPPAPTNTATPSMPRARPRSSRGLGRRCEPSAAKVTPDRVGRDKDRARDRRRPVEPQHEEELEAEVTGQTGSDREAKVVASKDAPVPGPRQVTCGERHQERVAHTGERQGIEASERDLVDREGRRPERDRHDRGRTRPERGR